jgi:hypothetical protein
MTEVMQGESWFLIKSSFYTIFNSLASNGKLLHTSRKKNTSIKQKSELMFILYVVQKVCRQDILYN